MGTCTDWPLLRTAVGVLVTVVTCVLRVNWAVCWLYPEAEPVTVMVKAPPGALAVALKVNSLVAVLFHPLR